MAERHSNWVDIRVTVLLSAGFGLGVLVWKHTRSSVVEWESGSVRLADRKDSDWNVCGGQDIYWVIIESAVMVRQYSGA